MGHGTNSKICRTVTDGPFLSGNMSKCTSDNKMKIHTGMTVEVIMFAVLIRIMDHNRLLSFYYS